jgi:hypothetical protein
MKALVAACLSLLISSPYAFAAGHRQTSQLAQLSPESARVTSVRKAPMVLEGRAEVEVDPDAYQKDVLVEWDNWRNNVVHAAWSNWGKKLDGGGLALGTFKMKLNATKARKFPEGTVASFSCIFTKDCHVTDLKIVDSSGDLRFDDLVLDSVKALDGKSVLSFPDQSRRTGVNVSCAFRIGKTEFRPHRFNDIETGSAQD